MVGSDIGQSGRGQEMETGAKSNGLVYRDDNMFPIWGNNRSVLTIYGLDSEEPAFGHLHDPCCDPS